MAISIRIADRPTLGVLQLDCTLSETHSLENEITTSPVELGADVTDHIRNVPQSVTLQGVVSSHADSLLGQFTTASTAHLDAWQTLREIWRSRSRFTITTSLRKYRNMVIASVSTRRDDQNTNILIFSATCREILFASVDLATNLADDTADLAGAADNLGTQGMAQIPDLLDPF